jgi:hypothetical protein
MYMLQLSVGTLPHQQLMHAIELYGTKVAPMVTRDCAASRLESGSHDVNMLEPMVSLERLGMITKPVLELVSAT